MNTHNIEPGVGAAGYLLGDKPTLINGKIEKLHHPDHYKINLENVQLWIKNGRITQIGLVNGFKGLINNKIGIGNTLSELSKEFGELMEDDEDNLILKELKGVCFETDTWRGTYGHEKIEDNMDKKITEIYVYPVD